MATHIASLFPQLSFLTFVLFLCATAVPAPAENLQPLSESLALELTIDDKDPEPECLGKHSALACTPLLVTVSNHAERGAGYVTSSCTHPRPFDFEFQSAVQREWQDVLLLRDLSEMEGCSGNVVEWVVVPPHDSVTFHTTLAEGFSPLALEKMERHLPITIRARWDGGACFAAAEEERKDESPLAFIHCASDASYDYIPSVTSKPLVLNSEAKAIPALRPAA